jgi:ssDNA-binding Zn-finger/Zn-ribbon topoisomerase 1
MKVAEKVVQAKVETIAIECPKCGVLALLPVIEGTTDGIATCGNPNCKATLKWEGLKEVKTDFGTDKQKRM